MCAYVVPNKLRKWSSEGNSFPTRQILRIPVCDCLIQSYSHKKRIYQIIKNFIRFVRVSACHALQNTFRRLNGNEKRRGVYHDSETADIFPRIVAGLWGLLRENQSFLLTRCHRHRVGCRSKQRSVEQITNHCCTAAKTTGGSLRNNTRSKPRNTTKL
jgi:hypothetical protein